MTSTELAKRGYPLGFFSGILSRFRHKTELVRIECYESPDIEFRGRCIATVRDIWRDFTWWSAKVFLAEDGCAVIVWQNGRSMVYRDLETLIENVGWGYPGKKIKQALGVRVVQGPGEFLASKAEK